jgi:pantetheine-phosphate adenylyltransferase
MGGTFDSFHKGHKILIKKAFKVGDRVIIGLTSDEFVSSQKKSHPVDSYHVRKKDLIAFLRELDVVKRTKIVTLNDPWGPTISDPNIEALVASEETKNTINKINDIRLASGLKPLDLITVQMVHADDCKRISSTRIREGEIDREGHVLINKIEKKDKS